MSLFKIDLSQQKYYHQPDSQPDDSIDNQTRQFNYTLEKVILVSKNGDIVDLIEVVDNIELVEGLYQPFVTGKITIVDPSGGTEKFVFSGGEEIHLTVRKNLKSDGIGDLIIARDDLIVTKIESYDDNEATAVVKYTFQLMSKAGAKNSKRRVWRMLPRGTSFSRSLYYIYQEHLSINGVSNLAVDRTFTELGLPKKVAIPGYPPDVAIRFLARRATLDGPRVFYERIIPSYFEGEKYFHFVADVDNLKSVEPHKTIIYAPALTTFKDIDIGKTLRTTRLHKKSGFDHLKNTVEGVYNSEITTHDIMNQTIRKNSYNIFDEFDSELSLNPFIAADKNHLLTNNDVNDYQARRFVSSTENDIVDNHEILERYNLKSAMNHLQSIQVQVNGGNNLLGIGDTVLFRTRSKIIESTHANRYIEDKLFSGKYLITATRHRINRDGYVKQLELSRDSLNIDLETIFTFTGPEIPN